MLRRSLFSWLVPCTALVVVVGCASQPEQVAAPADMSVAADSPKFENPGGMWMPTQMAAHAETLQSLGIEYDPAALTDPAAFPLGAIVSLGFCSGSFVSPDGLIVTNHHCAVPVALQYNSTAERNLLKEGYLAKNLAEELWAGPRQQIFVTTAVEEVTDKVRAGIEELTDVGERFKKIEANIKSLDESCNAENEDVRCSIRSFFEGAEFYQAKAMVIRDVRLVYAPHEGVGVFGGEIDNWRWPRHTGDFTFLRAYVGPDGKPADYAEDNVPFSPAHHLKVATKPLREGDLVMVAGYPGRTNRLATADLAEFMTDSYYPYAIERYEQRISLLEELAAVDEELAIKVNRRLRGWNNGLTNNRGMLDGLSKGGLVKVKAEDQAQLRAWIGADVARSAKYGTVLDQLATLDAPRFASAKTRYAESEIFGGSTLLSRAFAILDAAEKRESKKGKKGKKGKKTDGAKAEGADRTKGMLDASQRTFAPKADAALFGLALKRAAALPSEQQPSVLSTVLGDSARDDASIDALVADMYASSRLGEVDTVLKLRRSLNRGDVGKLKAGSKSKKLSDPFLGLASALLETRKAARERDEAYQAARSALTPRYVEALRAYKGAALAPDANSTLRVTYGTVRGYRPTSEADVYTPFTTLSEVVAKHTGEAPFVVPSPVLKAAKRGEYGGYLDEVIGEVPVDFLADLDITGGNSGSACINAAGEIVGLAFDGNYEAMASDWIFMPEITRSIQVDFRYVMWLMDAVDGADHLLREMGVEPSVGEPGAPVAAQ